VFIDGKMINLCRSVHFFIGGHGHPFFVDGQGNNRGPVFFGQRANSVQIGPAVFEIDGINDAPARVQLQNRRNAVGLCRVNHKRDFHRGNQHLE